MYIVIKDSVRWVNIYYSFSFVYVTGLEVGDCTARTAYVGDDDCKSEACMVLCGDEYAQAKCDLSNHLNLGVFCCCDPRCVPFPYITIEEDDDARGCHQQLCHDRCLQNNAGDERDKCLNTTRCCCGALW